MPRHMVILIGREEVAGGTMAFHFAKPDGFLYKAGQFADFTLIDRRATHPCLAQLLLDGLDWSLT